MQIRGGNRLHSQLPSECDYLQSIRIYDDYQLIIDINSSTRHLTVQPIATSIINAHKTKYIYAIKKRRASSIANIARNAKAALHKCSGKV